MSKYLVKAHASREAKRWAIWQRRLLLLTLRLNIFRSRGSGRKWRPCSLRADKTLYRPNVEPQLLPMLWTAVPLLPPRTRLLDDGQWHCFYWTAAGAEPVWNIRRGCWSPAFKLSLGDLTAARVLPVTVLLLWFSRICFHCGAIKLADWIHWFCLYPASLIQVHFVSLLLRLSQHFLSIFPTLFYTQSKHPAVRPFELMTPSLGSAALLACFL